MIKECIVCQKEFEAKEKQIHCSGACIAKEKRDKAAAKKKPKKKGRAPKPVSKLLQENMTHMDGENKIGLTETPPSMYDTKLDFKPTTPESFDGSKVETNMDEPELKFQKPPEPWIDEVAAYCESVNIFPQDLIEFHRTANKPKANKTPVLNYFEQRQKRMRGEE